MNTVNGTLAYQWKPEYQDGYEGVSLISSGWSMTSSCIRKHFIRFTDVPSYDRLPSVVQVPEVKEAFEAYKARSAAALRKLAGEAA